MIQAAKKLDVDFIAVMNNQLFGLERLWKYKFIKKRLKNMNSEKSDNEKPVNLLWTGGWDSTFRLLQIIFEEKRRFQPFYIVDLSRSSWQVEIRTMNDIKMLLKRDYPDSSYLLEPVHIVDKGDIPFDHQISDAWGRIKERRHIGKQYSWLAMFCKYFSLVYIELSIQRHTDSESVSESLIFNLHESRVSPEEKIVFKYFSFPLKELSKTDMARLSTENGWTEILEKTWFCHHPVPHPFKGKVPCGICNPCRVAIKEEFGYKIPFTNRVVGVSG